MLDAVVLNRQYEVVGVVDDFSSFIWTERYYQYCDFEIETKATLHNLNLYKRGYYIHKSDSDRLMVIKSIEYNTSEETGRTLLISGKDISYYLHRRIIWETVVLDENTNDEDEETRAHAGFQDGIKKLLDQNVLAPTKASRKIPQFVYKASTDPNVTSVKFREETQLGWTDNLYDTIEDLCNEYYVGFKVIFNSSDQFEFSLYKGLDRSYGQRDNTVVAFSPSFGNLKSSKFLDTDEGYADSALVAGEKRTETKVVDDTTQSRDLQYTVEIDGPNSGLDRYEMYIDQTSLKMFIKDIEVPPEKYKTRLRANGERELKKVQTPQVIEAELDYNGQFKYGKDYFLGDIVEVEDDMERTTKVRIVEMVYCNDLSGEYINPAFIDISKETEDE